MKRIVIISFLFFTSFIYSQTFELIYRTELDDWVGNAVFINQEEVAFIVSSGVYGTNIYPSKLLILNTTTGYITDSVNIEFESPEYNFAGARVISVLKDGTIIIRGFLRHIKSNERHIYLAHYNENLQNVFDTIFQDTERYSCGIRIYDDTLMVFYGVYNYDPPRIDFLEERDIYGNFIRGIEPITNSSSSTLYRTDSHYHRFSTSFRPYLLLNISTLQVDTIMNYSQWFNRSRASSSGYGDSYFIGAQRVRSPNKDNLVLLKMSNSGVVLGEFEYFTSRYSYFASSGIDVTGEFIFLGSSEFFTNNSFTFVSEPRAIQLIKLNHSGEVIWQKVYNYLDVNYRLEKVLATPDGGALLFATRYDWLDPIPFQRDVYILKVDSDGNTVVGTESIIPGRPGVMVYPNPASTVINIAVEKKAALSISVFNAIGSVVYTGEFTSSASIDVSGFRPGMYYYTISGQIGVHYSGRFIKIE